MESKSNTFLIGFFILSLVTGLAFFLIWMGRIGTNGNYTNYTVYMKESVTGIQDDSIVKFMGVDVGQITDIKLNPNNAEEVEVTMKIKNGTPIKKDTKAQLKVFGITGLTYIELSGGSNKSPALQPNSEGKLVITYAKSQVNTMMDDVIELSKKTSVAIDGLNKVLNDKNTGNMEKTLENLAIVTGELKGIRAKIDKLVDKTSNTENKVGDASDAIKHSAHKIDKLITKTEKLVDDSRQTVNTVNNHTLTKIDALLDETRSTVATYDRVGKEIEEHPSRLIWGK